MQKCYVDITTGPADAMRLPLCPAPPAAVTGDCPPATGPGCGCPVTLDDECWDCGVPGVLETRLLRRPRRCREPRCQVQVPAVPCRHPPNDARPAVDCHALCFDWTVDEPGPNDSYGLNGLNWHDWQMKGEHHESQNTRSKQMGFRKVHPGFSPNPPPDDDQVGRLVCTRPMLCYAREPPAHDCRCDQFATDVNYFRDWRCCEAKQQPAWRPPYKQWATGRA